MASDRASSLIEMRRIPAGNGQIVSRECQTLRDRPSQASATTGHQRRRSIRVGGSCHNAGKLSGLINSMSGPRREDSTQILGVRRTESTAGNPVFPGDRHPVPEAH